MLLTSKDKNLEKFYKKGKSCKIKQDLAKRVHQKLDLLDQATSVESLGSIPGNRLHGLIGKRLGTYAIAVNGPWRITFRSDGHSAIDVALEQYH